MMSGTVPVESKPGRFRLAPGELGTNPHPQNDKVDMTVNTGQQGEERTLVSS